MVATVSNCPTATVHDSGKVLYLVTDRSCAADGPQREVVLQAREGKELFPETQTLQMQEGEEIAEVTIPHLGKRRVGLFRAGQWRSFPNTNTWDHRDGAGLLVMNGDLYLLGGWIYGPPSNEVWKSSDVEHWQLIKKAPWPARHGAAWLVHDSRLWVIGGDLTDDVWSSPDGVNWTQEAARAPFGPRYTPNAASIGGRIVVYAGQSWETGNGCNVCVAIGPRDVWSSVDGRDWQLETAQAPWPGRGLIHGSIVHDGEIFLVGGGLKGIPPGQTADVVYAQYADIWSSRDGQTWTERVEPFSFAPRTHFSVVSTPQGCFVSDGSVDTEPNVTNDLFFAADCVNFAPVPDTPPLQPRHASSLAYFNGSLVILGGPPAGGAGTEVWQYFL